MACNLLARLFQSAMNPIYIYEIEREGATSGVEGETNRVFLGNTYHLWVQGQGILRDTPVDTSHSERAGGGAEEAL